MVGCPVQYVEVVKVNRQVLEREVFKDCTFQVRASVTTPPAQLTRPAMPSGASTNESVGGGAPPLACCLVWQPVVNPPGPRSRSPSPPRRGSGPPDDNDSSNLLPFPERLHPSEEQQREKRERLQRAKLQGEVRGCTFQVGRWVGEKAETGRRKGGREKKECGNQAKQFDVRAGRWVGVVVLACAAWQPRVNKSRGLDVDVLGGGMGEDEEDGVLSGPVYERLNKYHAAQQMRLQILKQRQEEEVRRRRALLLLPASPVRC